MDFSAGGLTNDQQAGGGCGADYRAGTVWKMGARILGKPERRAGAALMARSRIPATAAASRLSAKNDVAQYNAVVMKFVSS